MREVPTARSLKAVPGSNEKVPPLFIVNVPPVPVSGVTTVVVVFRQPLPLQGTAATSARRVPEIAVPTTPFEPSGFLTDVTAKLIPAAEKVLSASVMLVGYPVVLLFATNAMASCAAGRNVAVTLHVDNAAGHLSSPWYRDVQEGVVRSTRRGAGAPGNNAGRAAGGDSHSRLAVPAVDKYVITLRIREAYPRSRMRAGCPPTRS